MAFRYLTYITAPLNHVYLIQTDTSNDFEAVKYLDANMPNCNAPGPE